MTGRGAAGNVRIPASCAGRAYGSRVSLAPTLALTAVHAVAQGPVQAAVQAGMQAAVQAVRTPVPVELVGVFVFGLSGGLLAVSKRFDLFGVLVLAGAAALGGGVLRDVLLGATPPVGISDWRLVGAAVLAGLVTFVWHPGVQRAAGTIVVLDAAGLGLFSVTGTVKALGLGATPLAAVVVGVLTGVGGGALRDLFAGEVPFVFSGRELYATPALLGCAAVVALDRGGVAGPWAPAAVAMAVFGLRMLAVRFGLEAPQALGDGARPTRVRRAVRGRRWEDDPS